MATIVPSNVTRKTVIREHSPESVIVNTPRDTSGKVMIFRAYQVIWYILGIIESLLIIRFILRLTGARTASGFVRMIYDLTLPLIAPFRGIYPTVNVEGAYFEAITIVAMIIYLLIAWALVYLFQLVKPVNQGEVEETVDNP